MFDYMKRRSFIFSLTAIVVAASIEIFGLAHESAPLEEIKKYDEVKYSGVRHCQVRIDEMGRFRYRVAPADHDFTCTEFPEFDTEDEALEWAGVKARWNDGKLATNDRLAPELPMPVFPEPPSLSEMLTRMQEINNHGLKSIS